MIQKNNCHSLSIPLLFAIAFKVEKEQQLYRITQIQIFGEK